MKILYVDEAGCLGVLPSAVSDIQPVFVIVGLVLDSSGIGELTSEYLSIKRRFFPGLITSKHHLDTILCEVKGADIRRTLATAGRNARRAAMGFLDAVFGLVERHEGMVFGRVWIKGIGQPFEGRSIYSFSVQDLCSTFEVLLSAQSARGIIIADSRSKSGNSSVSHSIFTRKYCADGDQYPSLLEMPTFGHSDNHAGLQLADLIASAVLFPLAIQSYCQGFVTSVHTRDYSGLKARYGVRLRDLQYRYQREQGDRYRGGLTVSDNLSKRPGGLLFR